MARSKSSAVGVEAAAPGITGGEAALSFSEMGETAGALADLRESGGTMGGAGGSWTPRSGCATRAAEGRTDGGSGVSVGSGASGTTASVEFVRARRTGRRTLDHRASAAGDSLTGASNALSTTGAATSAGGDETADFEGESISSAAPKS